MTDVVSIDPRTAEAVEVVQSVALQHRLEPLVSLTWRCPIGLTSRRPAT
jgi:hypothetical protein